MPRAVESALEQGFSTIGEASWGSVRPAAGAGEIAVRYADDRNSTGRGFQFLAYELTVLNSTLSGSLTGSFSVRTAPADPLVRSPPGRSAAPAPRAAPAPGMRDSPPSHSRPRRCARTALSVSIPHARADQHARGDDQTCGLRVSQHRSQSSHGTGNRAGSRQPRAPLGRHEDLAFSDNFGKVRP